MKLYDKATGTEIKPGSLVTTERGTFKFLYISRESRPTPDFSTGRVYVTDLGLSSPSSRELGQDREYYPTVLNAEIR